MKKHMLWLSFATALIATAIIEKQPGNIFTSAKPVEKSVSFALYKGNNYTANVYDGTSATVHIIIQKVSSKKRITVWEKTFDAQILKKYPLIDEAVAQTVKIPNVFDTKEHLEVSYTLTYDSNGSKLQMQEDMVISGNDSSKVFIGI